jgi:hypothetical protein
MRPCPVESQVRYRVVRASMPLRAIAAGPFEIDQMIEGFSFVQGADDLAAHSTFP